MKLIDRISLQRAIKMLLDFILALIKILVPSKNENEPKKPKWRWRKDD